MTQNVTSSGTPSTAKRVFVCSSLTLVIFGFIILLTTIVHPVHEQDKQGLIVSIPTRPLGTSGAVDEAHSAIKQVAEASATENPEMREGINVSRKLMKNLPLRPPHSVPRLAPVNLPLTATSSPKVSSKTGTGRRSSPERRASNQETSHGIEESKVDQVQKADVARRSLVSVHESVSFHVDYTGPETHPPSNN